MRKAAVPDECLLDFLTGRTSLEKCLGDKTWMTALLVKHLGALERRWSGSHFLSDSLSHTLSVVFKQGYFESAEKSHSKMSVLMNSLKREGNREKLNLAGADLSTVCLRGADLSGADLSGANLSEVNLSGANLGEVNLSGADLSGANLSDACLYRANLSYTFCADADLSGANLSGANLFRAILLDADVSRADFSEANY
ncbi:MAG: pentapeptide repeat protein [Solimicrobium sp.]|jgi:uncharacterized protein YjbI with pentapeptide repeats|nr:pentapeptide repeat protein [Solimicrobium sp.]